MATKQIRTLEFEITLAPRNRPGGDNSRGPSGGGGSNYRQRQNDNQNDFDMGDHMETMTITQQPPRIIDAKNEQEFPSLGGPGGTSTSFSLRPNVSIRTQSYGPGGLARTKENFPALGGSSTTVQNTNSGSYKQGSASALLRNANAQQQKQQPGMVIHVSNRPATAAAAKKPEVNRSSVKDFPSLPGGKASKKGSTFLDTDFVPPAATYSNNIAAKHRSLDSGYDQFSGETISSKFGMVQRTEEPVVVTKKTDNLPKINSKHSFPALGNSPGAALAPQWVTLTKKAPVESRKSKVAPPPLSTSTSTTSLVEQKSTHAKSTVTTAASVAANNIKQKDVKPKPTKSPTTASQNQIDTKQNKTTKKNVQKPHQNYDDPEPEFVPSATVLHAVSAKHRSLVDSYESVSKPTSGSKLSLVQRDNSDNKTTQSVNVPKLNSKNMFPSLSATDNYVESNNNNKSINFTDIMKSAPVASNGTATTAKQRKSSPQNNNNLEDSISANISIAGPPPGFGGVKAKGTPAPPGFNSVTLNSVAKSSNNLQFTTSLGETFSILPAHKYLPPNNSTNRNRVSYETLKIKLKFIIFFVIFSSHCLLIFK